MKHGIKKQTTAADNTGNKYASRNRKGKGHLLSLTITEPRNFLRLELEITGEEMGLEKRVFKKNNLIRPANRKTLMLFCQEKRNWKKKTRKSCFLQMRLYCCKKCL